MTMAERAESTQKAEVWRLEGGGGGWRLGGAEANFAGDGVDFDAAAAGPDACAKRMFALLFDDDGNVGLDFAGDGVGGEMEIRVGRNAELHGAGGGLEIPIAGGAGIALHVDAAGCGVRFHIAGGAFDAHGAAGGGGLDASAGLGNLRGARQGADAHIALDVGDSDRAGSAVGAKIVADIVGANGAAERGDLRLALDITDADGAGGSFGFHRAAHILNRLRAGEHRGTDFGFARDFDHIRDVDVAHAAHLFADANGVAALFDLRIGDEIADAFFGAGEAHAGSARLGVDVHFAVGGAGDGNVARRIVELEANGSFDAERTIEAAGGGRSHGAAGASQSGEEQRERDRYGEITTLHYSSARVQANPAPVYQKIRRWMELCSQRRARSRALWLEGFVQGALAIAFEVEGDVGEACVFERLRDGGGHFGGQRARHFFTCDFDARELVVQAHAELLKAEMAEGGFAALDEAETLGGDFGAVGHARRETRGGGPVPGGEPGAMRKMANFGFAQAGVEEGREHAMFFGGAMAGAEVEGVVGVDAIGGGGETALLGEGVEDGEELVLAEEAAVGGVGAVRGIFHFAGFDEFVMDVEGADQVFDCGAIVGGEAG